MVIQPSQSGMNKISVCCRGLGVKSGGGECREGALRATRPEENCKENADDHQDQNHWRTEQKDNLAISMHKVGCLAHQRKRRAGLTGLIASRQSKSLFLDWQTIWKESFDPNLFNGCS